MVSRPGQRQYRLRPGRRSVNAPHFLMVPTISMDGKGRCMDNIFIERLWRSVKYEEIYLKDYETVDELRKSLAKYFHFYNQERPHQSFGEATPLEVYRQGLTPAREAA